MRNRWPKRTRVILADDDDFFLQHVARLLGPNFEIVGTFRDGDSVLRKYPSLDPQLLILDISMGRVSGLHVVQQILLWGFKPRTIFVTIHEEPELVGAALALGASGYVLKPRLNWDLNPAIEAALTHRVFVSGDLAAPPCQN